jgi:glucose uptake protein GlcU
VKNIISGFFFGIRDLLNGISNTVWGVALIFACILLFIHHPSDTSVIYYFAGVASTLLGIKNDHGQQNTFNNSSVSTPGPVNSSSQAPNSTGVTNA